MGPVAETMLTNEISRDVLRPAEQTLRYARDLARVNSLVKTYERLIPLRFDPVKPDLPSTRLCEATVLFTDLRGSTAIAERLRLEPDRLLSILNEHFEVAVRAIQFAGGHVEKFLGDGLMASFGVWDDLDSCAAHAVAAAIAIIRGSQELNARRAESWGFTLDVGIGIATGPVVAGSLGPRERCEMAILGDTVNIASRLTEKAEANAVMLCPATHQAVAHLLATGLVEGQSVRGRACGLERYRLQLEPVIAPSAGPDIINPSRTATRLAQTHFDLPLLVQPNP